MSNAHRILDEDAVEESEPFRGQFYIDLRGRDILGCAIKLYHENDF